MESLLGSHRHLRIYVFVVKHVHRISAEAALYLGKSPEKPLNFEFPVSYGNNGKHVADVPKFYLYAEFIPEDVINFYSCKTHCTGMYAQFGPVKIEDRISVYYLFSEGPEAGYPVDFFSGIFA